MTDFEVMKLFCKRFNIPLENEEVCAPYYIYNMRIKSEDDEVVISGYFDKETGNQTFESDITFWAENPYKETLFNYINKIQELTEQTEKWMESE